MVEAARPVRRKRGRGVRGGIAVVLVVLAVLIGRGLGLVGRDASDEPAERPADSPVTAQRGDAPAAPAASAAAPLGETSAPALPPAAAPAVVPPEPDGPGIDGDRFASLLSAIDNSSSRGEVGSALATLHHVRGLPLDAPQRTALALSASHVENGLAAACAAIVQALCKGRVLDANAAVVQLRRDGGTAVDPWLASALRAAGLEANLAAPAAIGDAPIPQPLPLPRGRTVRCVRGGAIADGVVADGRAGEVTLRLQGPAGVVYPTAARVACEPVDAKADEAIEMGFAALHAGDALLARLWLAAARLRDRSPLSPRGERLATLLP